MAGVLYQLKGSGDFTMGPSGFRGKYKAICLRCADQDEAYALALADAPAEMGGVLRGDFDVSEVGGDVYSVTAEYTANVRTDGADVGTGEAGQDPGLDPAAPPEGGGGNPASGGGGSPSEEVGREFSFNTGGGTIHVTQAIETIDSVAPGIGDPPDTKDAIGVSRNGVAGIDLPGPGGDFSISVTLSSLTFGYFVRIFGMSGRAVNNAPFKQFAAGEVLFLGAEGSYTGNGWKVNFRFKYSPNEINVKVGTLVLPVKAGWDIVDVLYREVKDELAGLPCMVQRPAAAYVRRVFRWSDFSVLAL